MFALIAVILFTLAAFGVDFDSVNIVYLAAAFLSLAVLVGNWPLGVLISARRE